MPCPSPDPKGDCRSGISPPPGLPAAPQGASSTCPDHDFSLAAPSPAALRPSGHPSIDHPPLAGNLEDPPRPTCPQPPTAPQRGAPPLGFKPLGQESGRGQVVNWVRSLGCHRPCLPSHGAGHLGLCPFHPQGTVLWDCPPFPTLVSQQAHPKIPLAGAPPLSSLGIGHASTALLKKGPGHPDGPDLISLATRDPGGPKGTVLRRVGLKRERGHLQTLGLHGMAPSPHLSAGDHASFSLILPSTSRRPQPNSSIPMLREPDTPRHFTTCLSTLQLLYCQVSAGGGFSPGHQHRLLVQLATGHGSEAGFI